MTGGNDNGPLDLGFLVEQIRSLRGEVTELRRQRVSYVKADVTDTDVGSNTFSATIGGLVDGSTLPLAGIKAPASFLPTIGDTVLLALSGAQPIYQPGGLAAGSVGTVQIADGAVGTGQIADGAVLGDKLADGTVGTAKLSFDPADYSGSTVYYGNTEPSPPTGGFKIGDLWLQTTGSTGGSGQPNYLVYRFTSGGTFQLLQDQGIADSLAAALNAQTDATAALADAATAQATADGKITAFFQATAPTSGMQTDDLWVDTDDNSLHRYNGSSWVSIQDAGISAALADAATAQATADGKMTIYAQPTAPGSANNGDLWFDTDDGNAAYVWGGSTTAFRQNWALNPSAEADAAGTVTTVTNWTNYTSGSVGTMTRSIVTTPGVSNRTKAAKSSSSSQAATAGVGHGFQQIVAAVPGDIVRVQTSATIVTTGSNFVPYVLIEFLDASNTVLSGSVSSSGSGTVTTTQTLSVTSAAAPASTTQVRVTLQRRTAATTGSALATSGIIFDSVLIEKNRAANAQTTYFDGASGGEAAWDGTAETSTSHTYEEGTTGASGWQPRRLRTGAFEPSSIVASDVIATGTVTAALLEAELVLASTVVAGDPNGDHAQLDQTGLYFVTADTIDGVPNEVARFGRNSGGANDSGVQTWNIDSDGVASFSALSLDSFPVVNGTALDNHLADNAAQGISVWYGDGNKATGIALEFGLAEVYLKAKAGRNYLASFGAGLSSTVNDGEYAIRLRWTTDGTRPTSSSPILAERFQTHRVGGRWQDWEFRQLFQRDSSDADVHILLTLTRGTGQSTGTVSAPGTPPFIVVQDAGPYRVASGTSANDGSGASSPVPQQLYTLTQNASWSVTFKGSGAVRSDTTDCVQGTDPSGFNGDGKAMIGFPDLTSTLSGATVRKLWVFLYANHWYYTSGGTAIIGTHSQTSAPASFSGTTNRLQSASWARNAGRWVDLTAYASEFIAGTSRGIVLGPSGSSNELYYGRFGGASDATHPPQIYVEYYK